MKPTLKNSKRFVLSFSFSCLLASFSLAMIALTMQLASDHLRLSLFESTPRTALIGKLEAVDKNERSVLEFFGVSLNSKKLVMTDTSQNIGVDLTCNGIVPIRHCFVEKEPAVYAKINYINVSGSNLITSVSVGDEIIITEQDSERNFNYFMDQNEIGTGFIWYGSVLFFISAFFHFFAEFIEKKKVNKNEKV